MKESILLQQLNESATLAMARMARELSQKGHDIAGLSLGEPDFNTPDFVKDAAIKAIHDNISHYPPVNGLPALRNAISLKFERDNGLKYSPEEIVVSTGAKQSIANTIYALINPGDEVILPGPFWVSYAELVRLAGGIPVVLQSHIDTDYKVSTEQLRSAVNAKTKLIIYSSPCNPTGTVYSKKELEEFAAIILAKPDLFVISDEIYEHINFTGTKFSIANIDGMWERTITVNGVSKAFAMTGWRIGYIGAPKWIANACVKMQGQITSGANSIAQMAAAAAVSANPEVIAPMVEIFRLRRDLVYAGLKTIPGMKVNFPEGAFYFFPDVKSYFGKKCGDKVITNADNLCLYLLMEHHVATVSGEAFGDLDCFRISYAASDEVLNKAIDRITKGLAALI
ncbi:MAG: pyridoxal phosphate-dependent aminotransferase [Flavobacteriales bacterium]